MTGHEEEPLPSRARRPATAVVCTHDRPSLLGDCVRAIAAAMSEGDELMVVESGDSGAAAALGSLGIPAVHVSVADHRKTVKLNEAVRRARYDVMVLTDDDCRVPSDWIDGLVVAFDDDRVGVAFGPVTGLSEGPGDVPPPRLPPGPAPIENWVYAHGASMAVRRAAVVDVGGFDERLGAGAPVNGGEEGDLVVRLAAAGWACAIASTEPVFHLAWRDRREREGNLLGYERGAGAWLGAAVRRDPRRGLKLLALRLRHEAELWRAARRDEEPAFARRAAVSFAGGLLRGLRHPPRRWL